MGTEPFTHAAITETVTLPSDVVLEILAVLHALDNYIGHVGGMRAGIEGQLDSNVSPWVLGHLSDLQRAAFGEAPVPSDPAAEDEFWQTWPPEVEKYVRGELKTAELLTLQIEEEGRIQESTTCQELEARALWSRARSAAVRDAATIDPGRALVAAHERRIVHVG